ncbi:UNVERIFIED_CONTAM: Ubiquitin carboxyl-terminal hydrolase 27 [Sesamum angustifolium]|uniref:Ubiquitin carboxyl-terminal hydrolase 27 n=1 Tax=Sesamum angustifolium TaxID=2727405 RepID=A0AAW2NHY7_9LAMI
MLEEYGSSSVEGDEHIPLVNSLTSLVEELCTVRHQRTVLSPRKLMLVMDHYIPNFNLTRQQDAEEAFSHLLSSLRDEISEYCVPMKSYLADLPALPNGRILITGSSEEENECQRWSRSFLKPFDGRPGCTLEDCLKKFFVAELVENYCCSNCWHTAAIDYLSRLAEDKANFPYPPRRHQTYRLISVVEHFGSSGGGHYTVYRKVTARLGDEDPVALLESTIEQWFCISDAEVHSVSEKDVLDANASMLFYREID